MLQKIFRISYKIIIKRKLRCPYSRKLRGKVNLKIHFYVYQFLQETLLYVILINFGIVFIKASFLNLNLSGALLWNITFI